MAQTLTPPSDRMLAGPAVSRTGANDSDLKLVSCIRYRAAETIKRLISARAG